MAPASPSLAASAPPAPFVSHALEKEDSQQPPVLDLSAPESQLVAAVRQACERWGFFQVQNHGVDSELRERFEAAMREFFALSTEEKLKLERSADNARGYVQTELTKQKVDNKECLDIGNARDWSAADDAPVNQGLNGVNRFPDEAAMPGFRATVQEYFQAMERLSERVAGLMALGMGVERDFFKKALTNTHTSHLRMNHYPELEDAHSALGVGPHTDSGFLTVLAQDPVVHTLEVRDRSTGEWVPVTPAADSFTINTGDLTNIFSNGVYHAPEHRVLGASHERYSAPYFYNPSYETEIKPVPSMVTKERPAQFHPMQWGYFRAMRVLGNFGDFGEYVKADMWRVQPDGSTPAQVERQERFMRSADYSRPFDINEYSRQMQALAR